MQLDIKKELLDELRIAMQQLLKIYKLQNTDVIESIEYVYRQDKFTLLANDYLQYISSGRRPRARKVPVEDILIWMKKKGITPRSGQTYNQLAFAIAEGIYKSGIKAKNFIDPMIDLSVDTIIDSIEIDIADQIETELVKTITTTLGK